jgi:prepilin-type N-terminal cleavage/methylation domain-containing protein
VKRLAGGFTLIELSIALAVVAVVLGLVILRFGGWSSRQASIASARTLGNTVRLYREKARLEGCAYALVVDLDQGAYYVTVPLDGGATPMSEHVVRRAVLPEGLSFGRAVVAGRIVESPVVLHFTPRGVVPETRLSIKNKDSEFVMLCIDALNNTVAYSEDSAMPVATRGH